MGRVKFILQSVCRIVPYIISDIFQRNTVTNDMIVKTRLQGEIFLYFFTSYVARPLNHRNIFHWTNDS